MGILDFGDSPVKGRFRYARNPLPTVGLGLLNAKLFVGRNGIGCIVQPILRQPASRRSLLLSQQFPRPPFGPNLDLGTTGFHRGTPHPVDAQFLVGRGNIV